MEQGVNGKESVSPLLSHCHSIAFGPGKLGLVFPLLLLPD